MGFYISKVSKQIRLWSPLVISNYFHKTTNRGLKNKKMTWLKDCKSCQENVSHSLAKRKLAEKNEWKFSNQSGETRYASIYLKNRKRSFFFCFFWLPYLEYHFIIANLVRLNLAVLKISIRQRDDRTLYSYRLTALLLLDRMHIITIFSLTWQ